MRQQTSGGHWWGPELHWGETQGPLLTPAGSGTNSPLEDQGRRSEYRSPSTPNKKAVAGEQGPAKGKRISGPLGGSGGNRVDPAQDQEAPHRVKEATAGPYLSSDEAGLVRPNGG
ncbi:hypothetical protein NDU88_001814 [Pleurodeles waltl]|uniref:Uncharacterized protein n=1 Tax=Pleurodeles waltl TaxID=8319 RepID=A0AAV7WJG8_PLEWA|nr:hypothetical protein NDU88_001814 [Pleurodeles waltl]